MSNQFAVKPTLDTQFPVIPDLWTCPITGLAVPKDPLENLQWRAHILELAEEDDDLRVDLYTACSQSVLFFVNAFVWTRRVFESSGGGDTKQADHKDVPMVTWDVQDRHILRIEQAVDQGEELLTDKSRDMGATWDHIAVYAHRFLFRSSESHLMISRKEDAVDNLDGLPKNYPFGPLADPGTLFGKLDYVFAHLPEWMIPRASRKKLHLVNLDTGTRVDGESANATAGSSDRRTSIFLDEMAKMREGEAIKRSTRDVTACRLACSTPNGAGTAFSKWRLSGQIPVFILAWWEHPEKGRDRYVEQDELGRWRIRSPWYDQEALARSPKELAIEVDMDHIGSGDTFFEGTIIEEHRLLYSKPTSKTMAINWMKSVPNDHITDMIARRDIRKISRVPGKLLRLWTTLINGRPDQTKTYTVACDIGKGMGASNSVISVGCNETREKIAEWADANTPPYEFARIATALCLWIGGKNKYPLLIWENNGDPGFDFGNLVMKYGYPNVYFMRQKGTLEAKRGKRWGWRSDREAKATALGLLRRAYAHGGFINHSAEALDEALTYIHYEDGGIGPATLVEENSSARACHGDRVIADMLCVVGFGDAPRTRRQPPGPPQRSIGYRLEQFRRKQRQRRRKTHFDFTGAA